MGLGAVVAASKSDGSLKSILVKSWFEERVEAPLTPDGYLRASALSSLCAREEILRFKLNITRKVKFNANDLIIFLHGKALHWGLQNQALPSIGVMYGKWKCLGCGEIYGSVEPGRPISETVVLRPNSCTKCGLKPEDRGEPIFQYVEHGFVNHEYRITGHNDGFLALPGLPGMGILEAKSAGGKSAWEVRHAPNVGHVIQAHVYMWLADLRWAKILYWVKGEVGMEALKEHHIDRDEATIGGIKALLTSIQIGLKEGTLPQRICETDDCPRASKCSTKKPCFKPETETGDISP